MMNDDDDDVEQLQCSSLLIITVFNTGPTTTSTKYGVCGPIRREWGWL